MNQRTKSLMLIVGLAVAVALVLAALFLVPARQTPGGWSAPDFTVKTLDGKEITLSKLRGTPVVINFWASWCPPCRDEAPVLAKVAADTEGQVRFLGLIFNDKEKPARAFIKEFNITYDNGMTDSKTVADYKMTGVPETFFISREGKIVKHWIGAISESELRRGIDLIR